jgi:hypothetical protein
MTHDQVVAIGSEVLALVRGDGANPILERCRRELQLAQFGRGSRSGNVAAGMLQLAFRDAVTFVGADVDGPLGGPDGCVNLTHSGNAGLAATVDLLDCVHSYSAALSLGGTFSRADLWALAGTAAVVAAMPSESVLSVALLFRSGRRDAADCDTADIGRYPNAEGSLVSLLAVFETRLGFTKREIVALMGAHSIGRAEVRNSGYEGVWLHDTALRYLHGSRYYRGLLRRRWTKNRSGGTGASNAPLFQWEHGGIRSHIMLSTDMALVYDIGDADAQNAAETGKGELVQCGPALAAVARRSSHEDGFVLRCSAEPEGPLRLTRAIVEEYAQENTGQALWATDFALAFTKLVELGFKDGLGLASRSERARSLGPASIISVKSLRTGIASALMSTASVGQDDGVPIERGGVNVFKIIVPAVGGVVLAAFAVLAITLLRRHQGRRATTRITTLTPVPQPVGRRAQHPVMVAWTEPDRVGASAAATDTDAASTAFSRYALGGLTTSVVTAIKLQDAAHDADKASVPVTRAIDTYMDVWGLDGIGDRSRSASRFVANE